MAEYLSDPLYSNTSLFCRDVLYYSMGDQFFDPCTLNNYNSEGTGQDILRTLDISKKIIVNSVLTVDKKDPGFEEISINPFQENCEKNQASL